MYFLPFGSRTRFAAFKDIPAVEQELKIWLAEEKTWEELPLNTILTDNIVSGTPVLGIFFQKDNTFITNDVGSPQISFEGNPKSLLFIVSDYKVASNSGSIYYDPIRQDYTRSEISPYIYEPTEGNLEDVWDEIDNLNASKVSSSSLDALATLLDKARSDITKLASRNDPLALILPAIAAEAGERRTVINDILQQIDDLQAPVADGVVDVTNYLTKAEFYDQLSRRATQGYVDGLLATKASQFDFESHIFNQSLHNPTPLEIGAPSNSQFESLMNRVSDLEDDVTDIKLWNPVKDIHTVGGVLAVNEGSGIWRIDSSYIGVGTGDKPQETSFSFIGPLAQSLNNGGGWVSWEPVNIIGIRATLSEAPVGAPVVLDILKEGVSIYTNPSNRPTFLEHEDEIIATLPDDTFIDTDEEITVDIINVGTTNTGRDLSIQMRYQYVI